MRKVVFFIAIFLSLLQTFHAQTPEISRNEKWREDISFYAEQLPQRHKNLFFKLTREEFSRDVEQLQKDVSVLDDNQIKLRLMIITAKVGDAHTNVWDKTENITVYPFKLRQFSEGWFVVEALPEDGEIVGKKLVKIEGVKIEEAAKIVRDVFPAENEFGVKDKTAIFLTVPLVLKAKNITKSDTQANFTFADDSGKESARTIKAQNYLEVYKNLRNGLFGEKQLPLALRNADKNYWFEYLPQEKTLYLAYNVSRQDKTKNFTDFARELFAVADKNQVEKFVVDVRGNEGGDSGTLLPLYVELKKRPQLTRKGKFFVLTSRKTFSAGVISAVQMREKYKAVWIGEPPSQSPVIYSELKIFELPNSKIQVAYSIKRFVLDKHEKGNYLPVDVAVEETFADYESGRDKVLEAVFNYKNK